MTNKLQKIVSFILVFLSVALIFFSIKASAYEYIINNLVNTPRSIYEPGDLSGSINMPYGSNTLGSMRSGFMYRTDFLNPDTEFNFYLSDDSTNTTFDCSSQTLTANSLGALPISYPYSGSTPILSDTIIVFSGSECSYISNESNAIQIKATQNILMSKIVGDTSTWVDVYSGIYSLPDVSGIVSVLVNGQTPSEAPEILPWNIVFNYLNFETDQFNYVDYSYQVYDESEPIKYGSLATSQTVFSQNNGDYLSRSIYLDEPNVSYSKAYNLSVKLSNCSVFAVSCSGGETDTFDVVVSTSPIVDITPVLTYDECDSLDVFCYIKNAFRWAFYLNPDDFTKFSDLQDTLSKKPPFGYITGVYDLISGINDTETPTIELESFAPVTDNIFSPIRTGLSWFLWIGFAFLLFRRFRDIQI